MRFDWKNYSLEDVCERIYSGGTPSTKHSDYWNGELKWLSSGETSQRFIYDTERKITQRGVENSSTKLATKGCTVIATAGQGYTRGQASFLMTDTYMNQSVIACKAKENIILPLYLYYNLDNRYEEFRLLSDGTSTRGGLSGWILKRMEISLPNIEVQRRIVSILYSIDQKIELNNAINNNLLEQLNQLFIEFSTRCEWNYLSIGEIAEKVAMGPFGSNIKVSTFVESGVPIISGNHLRGYFLEEPSYNYITEAHADKLKNSIVYPKDIVFTHAGNIGQAAMIPDGCEYPYYVLSQRQFYLRCNTMMVAPEYVLLFFHSKQGQHELLSYANQTGVPSIAQPASNLKKICLPIPPISEQKKWLLVVEPIIAMYQNNYQETKRLSILRDTLLPKLMSGELDVSDIDL